MAQLLKDEILRLREAVRTHEFLRRIVREVERLLRLVFHRHELDVMRTRASAEDIVIVDIAMRHRGNFDGIYHALRAAEDAGRSWDQALAEYAGNIHAYYTTPLGLIIRRDVLGAAATFATPTIEQFTRAFGDRPGGAATGPPVG
ncbi:MAG: hypothetical protein U1A27_00995 [Phycisphaerae bacterium]